MSMTREQEQQLEHELTELREQFLHADIEERPELLREIGTRNYKLAKVRQSFGRVPVNRAFPGRCVK